MTTNSVSRIFDNRQNRIQSLGFVIATGICILLAVIFSVPGISRPTQDYEIQLLGRINPNSTPVASLVRLPGIGLVRAWAIVTWREDFSAHNGQKQAFETADDLQKIKGIGPKTVQNITKWLKFEQKVEQKIN